MKKSLSSWLLAFAAMLGFSLLAFAQHRGAGKGGGPAGAGPGFDGCALGTRR